MSGDRHCTLSRKVVMGDWHQTIVDANASAEEATQLASAVLEWLVTEGIVEADANDVCVYGGVGHPPGPHFGRAIVRTPTPAFLKLLVNGMRVATGRTVFHAGGTGFSVACPACRTELHEDRRWGDAVRDWCDGGACVLSCPSCQYAASVTLWVYDPVWGFGNLGFTFWNWPKLKPAFVKEVSRRLGHQTVLVVGKL